jgi:hypothetical protein
MSRYTKANHTVYMTFHFRNGWHVQFNGGRLEDAEKIRELAKRGEAWATADARARDRDGEGRCVLATDARTVSEAEATALV